MSLENAALLPGHRRIAAPPRRQAQSSQSRRVLLGVAGAIVLVAGAVVGVDMMTKQDVKNVEHDTTTMDFEGVEQDEAATLRQVCTAFADEVCKEKGLKCWNTVFNQCVTPNDEGLTLEADGFGKTVNNSWCSVRATMQCLFASDRDGCKKKIHSSCDSKPDKEDKKPKTRGNSTESNGNATISSNATESSDSSDSESPTAVPTSETVESGSQMADIVAPAEASKAPAEETKVPEEGSIIETTEPSTKETEEGSTESAPAKKENESSNHDSGSGSSD